MSVGDGFEWRGAEVISLGVAYTESAQSVEFVVSFDAFGDDLCAGLGREADQRCREGATDWVHIDAADQVAVELDEVRGEFEDVSKTGIARAGVVNRDPCSGSTEHA
jgi:hypothetical protein